MTRPSFSVPADHPALAGHFPGFPVVPGSMLLEQVLVACPGPIVRVDFVKFLAPVPPDAQVDLLFSSAPRGDSIDFQCRLRGELVCSGRLRIGSSA